MTISKTFTGVVSADGSFAFDGTYSPIVWNTENKSILFLGDNNKLFFPQPSGDDKPYINACRAYFQLYGIEAGAVAHTRMIFDDETTGILNSQFSIPNSSDAWYSLDGRKLNVQPTQKGVYIHNGRIVVK